MKQIKNGNGKLVCQIDEGKKIVEIVRKYYKTTIRFLTDGRVEIINTTTKTV